MLSDKLDKDDDWEKDYITCPERFDLYSQACQECEQFGHCPYYVKAITELEEELRRVNNILDSIYYICIDENEVRTNKVFDKVFGKKN